MKYARLSQRHSLIILNDLCAVVLVFRTSSTSDEYTESTSFRKLESITAEEPDLIVTMCAGCQLILDRFQRQFEERFNRVVPVLNVSQLVALLLGADKSRDACLQFSTIDVAPLIEKMEAV